jgi:hypothetical protein
VSQISKGRNLQTSKVKYRKVETSKLRTLTPEFVFHHKRAGLDQMNLMITDEDPKCYHQIAAAKQVGVLPKVVHRLCCWHKVNRNYTLKVRSKVVTVPDKQFTRIIEKWLYSFTNNTIETSEENAFSMEAFEHYLSHSECSPALKLFTQQYWEKVSFRLFYLLRFRYLAVSIFGGLDIWHFWHVKFTDYKLCLPLFERALNPRCICLVNIIFWVHLGGI